MKLRSGFSSKFSPPPDAGHIVSMIKYKNEIVLACEFRVYRLVNGEFVPLRFADAVAVGGKALGSHP